MTCIAGMVGPDGRVVIGGDSCASNHQTNQLRADPKVFRRDEFLIGFTSSFRMGQLLRHHLLIPAHWPGIEVGDYMATSFIDAVRTCLKDGGFARVHDGEESGGSFLVGYRGRLFSIEEDFQVAESLQGYMACGSGERFALGSMASTDGSPGHRVHVALRVASEFSPFVRPPFHILETPDAKADRPGSP